MTRRIALMVLLGMLCGCASDGSFCPPDPLGAAVFTYFHHRAQAQRAALQQPPPSAQSMEAANQSTQYIDSPRPAPPRKSVTTAVSHQPREYAVALLMPPLMSEARLPSPGFADPVWINGYWQWKKSQWVWKPGYWVQRPRRGVEWVNAQYYTIEGQNYWRDGYWR